MAKLQNTFSWSFSAASDFDECRRKRYWGKYAMWGGWESGASEIQKKAYRLNKMSNRYSIQGNAVECAVMWVLKEKQAGRDVTVDDAYEQQARPFLNNAWKESKGKMWLANPKKHCCLHEHYYSQLHEGTDKQWTDGVIATTKRCIENFINQVLPRLKAIQPDQEIEIATPDKGGDPESFEYEGIKVYAIPDYVYRDGDTWHIIDWKSGKAKAEHQNQLALYGLWANQKYNVPAENIIVYIEYLAEGKTAVEQLTQEHLDSAKNAIGESVADMRDYLVDGDIARNEAVGKDEWELATSMRSCRLCNFYELCEPELKALE